MRPPEVFVRDLDSAEANRLKSISRKARYQSKRERAMICLASHTGMAAPQIAELVRTDPSHVRKVIHAFNEEGFDSLDPDYRGGRPKKASPAERDKVIATARARPDTQGVPLTRWSLRKLAPHLAGADIELSPEALRRLLAEAGLSHRRTRSWKRSPDPLFEQRAERVLALYREPPADGPVVCFDEMSQIRMRYDPRLRIYLVQDNLSCHWTKEVRAWAEAANMELAQAPWLESRPVSSGGSVPS